MALTIRGHLCDVDIATELAGFAWTRPTWLPDKLIAASPFRYDTTPSFYVHLCDNPQFNARAGDWGDSGAYDADWARGGFVRLLAFLRDETEEETEDYLIAMYAVRPGDQLRLRLPSLRLPQPPRYLPDSLLDKYAPAPVGYLARRRISTPVQRLFGVRSVNGKGAVAMPWYAPNGRLGNVKYRATRGKAFWYAKGGQPVRRLVYGMNIVYSRRLRQVALVEAEIDAMSLWTVGVPAIAVGGSTLTREQADIIRRSPIEALVIATDNDEAGEKLRGHVRKELRGSVRMTDVRWGVVGAKDANEALVADNLDHLFDGYVKVGADFRDGA